MKKIAPFILVAFALSIVAAPAAWAKTCPKVYKEGKDLLAEYEKMPGADKEKIKKFNAQLEEAIGLHNKGLDHEKSVAMSKEVIAQLKKLLGKP
ncbi:MAG: hypothetical protein ACK4Z6_02980 [Candidatus Methylomirabilales bacterium]